MGNELRIVVHDYSGHPGQVQLSRALTKRGHRVIHQHCPSYVTGKGAVERLPDDPSGLTFEPCPMKSRFDRYSFVHRGLQELAYGARVGRLIANEAPDVAIISNVPLLAHALLSLQLRRRRIPMIFWHQDIYSSAIGSAARRRLPRLGPVVGWAAEMVERSIARASAAVVAISPTFLEKLDQWGVGQKTTVIPNWAPLNELPVHARRNAWSERMGLSSGPVVMYTGTLGLKHDPSILAQIAGHLAVAQPDARVVVVSEGKGREWLDEWKAARGADNLVLLDYQRYEDLPMMMASADVLLAILEPDASRYSVPSKVLTYLCSGRAIVGILPRDNSVAQILWGNNVGLVADPTQRHTVAQKVAELLRDEMQRQELGAAGRLYAERSFCPDHAAEEFEAIFDRQLLRSAA